MFGLYSDKFITLEKKWEIWIGKQLRFYIESEHTNYINIPAKYREFGMWLINDIKNTVPIIHMFSKRWIPNLWQSEEECLSFMRSPEEILYIIQYVHSKYFDILDLNLCNVIEKFICYFTKDLLKKNNKYITHSLQYYVNVNIHKLNKRKNMGALCLNRIRGFDGNIHKHILTFLN